MRETIKHGEIRNKNVWDSDLTGNGTYKGPVRTRDGGSRSIVGQHRLLVRHPVAKMTFVYIWPERLTETIKKYGKDFIKDCGIVKQD